MCDENKIKQNIKQQVSVDSSLSTACVLPGSVWERFSPAFFPSIHFTVWKSQRLRPLFGKSLVLWWSQVVLVIWGTRSGSGGECFLRALHNQSKTKVFLHPKCRETIWLCKDQNMEKIYMEKISDTYKLDRIRKRKFLHSAVRLRMKKSFQRTILRKMLKATHCPKCPRTVQHWNIDATFNSYYILLKNMVIY